MSSISEFEVDFDNPEVDEVVGEAEVIEVPSGEVWYAQILTPETNVHLPTPRLDGTSDGAEVEIEEVGVEIDGVELIFQREIQRYAYVDIWDDDKENKYEELGLDPIFRTHEREMFKHGVSKRSLVLDSGTEISATDGFVKINAIKL